MTSRNTDPLQVKEPVKPDESHGGAWLVLAAIGCVLILLGIPAGMLFAPFLMTVGAGIGCCVVAAAKSSQERRAGQADYCMAAFYMGIVGAVVGGLVLLMAGALGCVGAILQAVSDASRLRHG